MASSTSERVKRHREALRRAGLRPVQRWLIDTRRPGFKDECRRQSLSLSNDPQEADILKLLDEAADRGGWE
jgi:hypothetical protein